MIKQRDEERGGELGYNGILLHFIPLYPSSKPTNCTRKMCQVILTISNAVLEGINSIIQTVRSRARGFRNIENFIAMIYLLAGKLTYNFSSNK